LGWERKVGVRVKGMMNRFLLLMAVVAVLWSCGCGVYTFSPAGKGGLKSVAVERFGNETAEFELADRMTDLVIDAVLRDGTMKVVSTENAEALLTGSLARYELKPYQYDENDVVESYAVVMTFDIALKKPADESEMWKETMTQEGVYNVASETEEDGQERAIEWLVEAIVNRTSRDW